MAKDYGLNEHGQPVDITRGDLVRFFAHDLLPFEGNYRWSTTDKDAAVTAARDAEIEEMVCSLCSEGQKMPIKIHGVSGKRFQVHAGDTRHRAFLRIEERRIWPFSEDGIPRVECTVDTNGDPKKTFGTSITENIARNALNIIDIANAVSIATDDYKYTDAEILQKFQQAKPDGTPKDPAWLPNMRRLARLPIERKREIYLGLMAASVGYLLAEIPEERHAEVLAEAAGEAYVATIEDKHGLYPQPGHGQITGTADPDNFINDDPRAETYSEMHPREDDDEIEAIREVQGYAEAEAEPTAEPTLDYTESQTAPIIQPNKQPKKRKKVTARAVAEVAKSKGLLAHKKVSHTLAGMRSFWEPLAHERNAETRLGQIAAASLEWMASGSDDEFYKKLLKIIKETK